MSRDPRDVVEMKAAPKWTTPYQRALKIGGRGEQLQTRIPSFDVAMRGGPRTGRVIVIGGAPGAGKTTLVVQLAWRWALDSVFVGILAADEDGDGLLVRIGQMEGIHRDDLENGEQAARKGLASFFSDLPNFLLVDADEDGAILETVSAELANLRPAGASSVLIVDSLQTVRSNASIVADSPRARIDAVMGSLKKAAKVDGHLVIATCELARGAYRSTSDRIDDLASFKESGGIEYGASTALVLRSVPGGGGFVDVAMAKNRAGTKASFRLALNYDRAEFTEVAIPEGDEPSPLEQVKERVLEIVAKSVAPIKSKGEIARRTRKNKASVIRAINELLEDERLLQSSDKTFTVPGRSRTVPEQGSVLPVPTVPPPKGGTADGTVRWNGGEP